MQVTQGEGGKMLETSITPKKHGGGDSTIKEDTAKESGDTSQKNKWRRKETAQ